MVCALFLPSSFFLDGSRFEILSLSVTNSQFATCLVFATACHVAMLATRLGFLVTFESGRPSIGRWMRNNIWPARALALLAQGGRRGSLPYLLGGGTNPGLEYERAGGI